MSIPELVAPAGSFETLEAALNAGADAVYLGPRQLGLRASDADFDGTGLRNAIERVRLRGKKVYVALNALLHGPDIASAAHVVRELQKTPPNAVIISDLGLIESVKEAGLPFHVSTQCSITNSAAAKAWVLLGAKRIILARELALAEVATIVREAGAEIEVFAHGAMCVAYSGRCLMSDYLAKRGGNRGECAQACRWPVKIGREGFDDSVFTLEENNNATFILNSRDLCTLPFLNELAATGVKAIKIEGRNKGAHYITVVVQTYRSALNALASEGDSWKVRPEWVEALSSVTHRTYTSGFYKELSYNADFARDRKNRPLITPGRQNDESADFIQTSILCGVIRETLSDGRAVVDVRARIHEGAMVSLFSPDKGAYLEGTRLTAMTAVDGTSLAEAHPNRIVLCRFDGPVSAGSLVRL